MRTIMMRCLPALAACVLTTLCMTGCASGRHRLYAGPVRPADQVAQIKSTGWLESPVRLFAVDGQRGPNGAGFGYASWWDGSYHIDILPGMHTLTVRHLRTSEETDIRFETRQFHTYLVGAAIKNGQGQYVIVDKTENRWITREGQYTFPLNVVQYAPPPGYVMPMQPMMPPPRFR
jgi:hypothetical protein